MSAEKKAQTSNTWFDSKAVMSRLAYIATNPYRSLLSPSATIGTLTVLMNAGMAVADKVKYYTDPGKSNVYQYKEGTDPGLSIFNNLGDSPANCNATEVSSNVTTGFNDVIKKIMVTLNTGGNGPGADTRSVLCEQWNAFFNRTNSTEVIDFENCMKNKMPSDCTPSKTTEQEYIIFGSIIAGISLLGCIICYFRNKYSCEIKRKTNDSVEDFSLNSLQENDKFQPHYSRAQW